MSKEETKVAEVGAQTSANRRVRRGVSNETRAISQLKFHEKDAAANGLFVAHLHEVTVDWSTNADSASFAGISIPRLSFHFASNHANVNEMRHVYQTIFPVESSVDTIPNGKDDWKVNNVLKWIKHILDVFYLKGRPLTEEEETALELPFVDFDENGQYIPVEAETVVAGYRSLFENAAAMLNGSFKPLADGEIPKPSYKTADGKYIPCWIKLLRCKKVKNQWQNIIRNGNNAGDLSFDFIGSGVVELQRGTNPPAILRLDLSKESITPQRVDREPTIGAPGSQNLGNVMTGGMPVMGPSPINSAFSEAASAAGDMPF